mgnify:CR=1 FL=1
MTTDLFTVHPDELIHLAAHVMDWKHVRHVPVEDNDHRLVGLVTHRTLLRLLAGLEELTEGNIYIGDNLVNDVAPKDRDIAMVFQDYALYPHLNVFRNMSFGLEMKKLPAAEIKKRVHHAAEILSISELLDRKPKQLSGGQRQRVAMGRAIVRNPNVFLFDEPLSNLDAKLRTQMRTEIKKLHRTVATTIIYVTHDQVEALTFADKVVVMYEGEIVQIGSPQDLFENPEDGYLPKLKKAMEGHVLSQADLIGLYQRK